jgi:hypothetical protein
MATEPTFREPSFSSSGISFLMMMTEMTLKTLAYLPFNHLMQLLSQGYFIETIVSLKVALWSMQITF